MLPTLHHNVLLKGSMRGLKSKPTQGPVKITDYNGVNKCQYYLLTFFATLCYAVPLAELEKVLVITKAPVFDAVRFFSCESLDFLAVAFTA